MSAARLHELGGLVELFFPELSDLGDCAEVDADSLPDVDRQLLAQNHHMTGAVESFQESPVQVDVLEWRKRDDLYWRKILLRRAEDAKPVLFAIVRLNFSFLNPETRRRVEQRAAPVGRILVEDEFVTKIEVRALWRIMPAEELCHQFRMSEPSVLYGRTALIYCHGEPAIELLEILAPV